MKAKFNYPPEFQTLPEYRKHCGHVVSILRALTAKEADFHDDPELERMFRVQAADGWEGDVFESELEFVPSGDGDILAYQMHLDRLVVEAKNDVR